MTSCGPGVTLTTGLSPLAAIQLCNTIRSLHTASIAMLARFSELRERRRNSENMMRAQVLSSLVRPRRTCFSYVLFEALENHDAQVTQQTNETQQSTYHTLKGNKSQVLLSTAIVKLRNPHVGFITVRAILDHGSQTNFISERVVQQLHLKKRRNPITLQAFGDLISRANSIPSNYIHHDDCNIPQTLSLTDRSFHTPQTTDILLGARVFMQLLVTERRARPGKYPILQNIQLGWIFSGEYPQAAKANNDAQFQQCLFLRLDNNLEKQLQNFWNLEEVNEFIHPLKSHSDHNCYLQCLPQTDCVYVCCIPQLRKSAWVHSISYPALCVKDIETKLRKQVDFNTENRFKHSPEKGPIDLWAPFPATASIVHTEWDTNTIPISKMNPKCRKLWKEAVMKAAIISVRNKVMGLQRVSNTFNVPKYTLKDKVNNKGGVYKLVSTKLGIKPVLPFELEDSLVSYCLEME
ncbi:hypothetical protein ANN_14208 [Periplaneta americana]|uniref:HTH psq-type domain-containing protein n=1 Tax=Periplaneta americana TaxID=6978 RepID=A0ABQ8SVP2_PERAM|nr:hypothetical protein ANN_14208 [Periplaneta americana]